MAFAMRLYIVLFAALMVVYLLSGCSGMVKTVDVATTLVHWDKRKPVECDGWLDANGCATRINNYAACIVTMPEDSPDWLIAHEFRHCFGFEHIGEMR